MNTTKPILLAALLLYAAAAQGQSASRLPHIGYLYPAGGQQGTTFVVTVGGQYLNRATDVYVTGRGVKAKVNWHARFIRNLNGDQKKELRRRIAITKAERTTDKAEADKLLEKLPKEPKTESEIKRAKLPDYPPFDQFHDMSLKEIDQLGERFLKFDKKRQPNAQIGETVQLEVTIAPDAQPGDREIRLGAGGGLTNPMCFQVGILKELAEEEPNNPNTDPRLLSCPVVDAPILLNGQILPGDVDRFKVRAKRGQRLVMQVHARHLIPYLADAVPGWFQATLRLFDPNKKEVAFVDDYLFHPDPVLLYEVPEDGVYELEIQDAIYRGREDFIYRISVGEHPFITQVFPLGGKMGAKTTVNISGWNLDEKQLVLDTRPGHGQIRQTAVLHGNMLSNSVPYAVDMVPESTESEPNNTIGKAQRVSLPRIINGRIDQPGDTDIFVFDAEAESQIVAETIARRLYSPIDSLIRLTDKAGKVIAWNDDYEQKDGYLHMTMGLLTHPADAYLTATLPKTGKYYIHVVDAQQSGGQDHAYRLRISPPRPDFELRMSPSSITIRPGGILPVWIHALRKDGFKGAINVDIKYGPEGFALHGGRIPAGKDRILATLQAPNKSNPSPVYISLEGKAKVGTNVISRRVIPAEDMMQAFLWRHLVPSQELAVNVRGSRYRVPPVKIARNGPVRIPAGGTARIQLGKPKNTNLKNIQLVLKDPPEGLRLQNVRINENGLALILKADLELADAGVADNLFFDVFRRSGGNMKDGKKVPFKRTNLGILPAIPFEIIRR